MNKVWRVSTKIINALAPFNHCRRQKNGLDKAEEEFGDKLVRARKGRKGMGSYYHYDYYGEGGGGVSSSALRSKTDDGIGLMGEGEEEEELLSEGDPDSLVSVPGFGFLPRWFYSDFRRLSSDIDSLYPDRMDANDTERRNSAKCGVVTLMFEVSRVKAGWGMTADIFMCQVCSK